MVRRAAGRTEGNSPHSTELCSGGSVHTALRYLGAHSWYTKGQISLTQAHALLSLMPFFRPCRRRYRVPHSSLLPGKPPPPGPQVSQILVRLASALPGWKVAEPSPPALPQQLLPGNSRNGSEKRPLLGLGGCSLLLVALGLAAVRPPY